MYYYEGYDLRLDEKKQYKLSNEILKRKDEIQSNHASTILFSCTQIFKD